MWLGRHSFWLKRQTLGKITEAAGPFHSSLPAQARPPNRMTIAVLLLQSPRRGGGGFGAGADYGVTPPSKVSLRPRPRLGRTDGRMDVLSPGPPRRTPNKPPQSLFVAAAAAAPRFIPRTDFSSANMRSGSRRCSLPCCICSTLKQATRGNPEAQPTCH